MLGKWETQQAYLAPCIPAKVNEESCSSTKAEQTLGDLAQSGDLPWLKHWDTRWTYLYTDCCEPICSVFKNTPSCKHATEELEQVSKMRLHWNPSESQAGQRFSEADSLTIGAWSSWWAVEGSLLEVVRSCWGCPAPWTGQVVHHAPLCPCLPSFIPFLPNKCFFSNYIEIM